MCILLVLLVFIIKVFVGQMKKLILQDVVKRIVKAEGIFGFYRGYLACKCILALQNIRKTTILTHKDLSAYAPGSAVQWGSYELSKGLLHRALTFMEHKKIFSSDGSPIPQKEHLVNAASGGLAAFCAVSANNPLEVLRIRLQLLDSTDPRQKATLNSGYIPLFKQILTEEGWRTFYKGLKVRMFLAVPTAMIAMSGYETVKAWSLD